METDTRFKEVHQQLQQQQQQQQHQQKQQHQQFKSSTVNSSPSNGTPIVRNSSSNTPNIAKKKEKNRIILAYYVFALSPSSNHGLNSESTRAPTTGKASPLTVIKRYLSTSSSSLASKSTSVAINSNNSGQGHSSANENELDEESIALLCLPDGSSTINELLRYPHEYPNKFHTFLITRQNGHRYYGSSLIVRAPNSSCSNRFHVHCVITEIPFVTPTRQLLLYFAHIQPDQTVIQRICNLRIPGKGKCLKLLLPTCNINGGSSSNAIKYGVNNQSLIHMSPFNTDSRVRSITNSPSKSAATGANMSSIIRSNVPSNNVNDLLEDFLGEGGIYIYRGTADFPLLDYPLRQLFCDVLSPQIFIQLLTATLLEYQVLLISNDYYKLMLVSETLTSLLAPFTWQHVYVPILPVSLGLHYLDAPTPYIMGLNSDLYMLQVNQQQQQNLKQFQQQQYQQQSYSPPSLPPISLASLSVTHTSQVRLFCDENKIEFIPAASEFEGNSDFVDESLDPPPFLQQLATEIELILNCNVKLATLDTKLRPKSALMNVVANAARKHDLINDKFTYLDDLKLNHLIRVTCSTLLQYNLLREYQKFIVTNDGGKFSHGPSSFMGGFKFDSVAFLSDQPDSLVPFMGKFLQTQMFASFIDDKCKKLRKLRSTSSNQANVNYLTLDPLVLTVRRNSHITETKIHSIALSIDSVYDGAFEDATIVNLNELDISKSCSSPRRQRKVYDRLDQNKTLDPFEYKDNLFKATGDVNSVGEINDLKSNLGLNFNNGSGAITDASKYSPFDEAPSALVCETNWRIVESLLRETKIKTKRILLEKMSSDEITPLGLHPIDEIEGNTLIASLCDLIERVWTHGLKCTDQSTLGSCSSFWSYTSAHCDQEFQVTNDRNDTLTTIFQPDRMTVIKNGTIDSPGFIRGKGQLFLSHSTPASPMRFSNNTTSSNRAAFAPGSRNFSHFQGGSLKYSSSNSNQLASLPTSLQYDVSSIASMIDVKTDHGKTRAFLRLALERKLLSSHLKVLCNNQGLLMAKYRRSAFLRAEDEREQFITHLLTLNAVDILCFTNTFTTSTLSYRFLLYSSGPLNGSFVLSGTLNDSSSIAIEGNEMSFLFKAKNLGLIKFLTLTTFTSKVYVDFILIRNEVTGHLFRFNCNKWFGRNVDDDSCERVLLAEHITDPNIIGKIIEKTGQKTSSIGRQFRRGLSSTLDSISGSKSELTSVDQLRHLLSNKIDQVLNALQSQNVTQTQTQTHKFNARKYPEQSNNGSHVNEFDDIGDENEEETLQLVIDPYGQGILEAKTSKVSSTQLNPLRLSSSSSSINTTASAKSVGSQIATSLGYQQLNQLYFAEETGLFPIVLEALYFGFKNRGKSPFRKQIFLWDYLLRIQVEFKLSWRTLDANGSSVPRSTESSIGSPSNGSNNVSDGVIRRKFIEIIEGINSHAMYRGKDAKALMFVAISIRNKLLAPHFIRLLSWSPLATQFYQVNSFLTNPVLTVALVQLLVKLNQVNIHTDSAVTKGM